MNARRLLTDLLLGANKIGLDRAQDVGDGVEINVSANMDADEDAGSCRELNGRSSREGGASEGGEEGDSKGVHFYKRVWEVEKTGRELMRTKSSS